MTYEQRLKKLIRAGRRVIDSNFDEAAYLHWREQAADCLAEMFGPRHFYCQQFENKVRRPSAQNLLICGGILEAAKEGVFESKRIEGAKPESESQSDTSV